VKDALYKYKMIYETLIIYILFITLYYIIYILYYLYIIILHIAHDYLLRVTDFIIKFFKIYFIITYLFNIKQWLYWFGKCTDNYIIYIYAILLYTIFFIYSAVYTDKYLFPKYLFDHIYWWNIYPNRGTKNRGKSFSREYFRIDKRYEVTGTIFLDIVYAVDNRRHPL